MSRASLKEKLQTLSPPPQTTTKTTKLVYTRPWVYPKQRAAIFEPVDLLGNPARFSMIEASTKTGKTVGCIIWLFEQAIAAKGSGQNFWWIAPVYMQAKIAFTRMKRAIPKHILVTVNESDLIISLPNGSVISFKSGEKPDNLYGEDVYAAVIDEASRTRAEAWHALRSTLTATRGMCRMIGNVKGRKNWFYEMCRRAETGAAGLSYHKLIAHDAVAAGILTAQEIEDAKRDLPDAIFRELYLAEPSDDGGNPFGITAISKCIRPLSLKRPVCWGWDLGKSVDWTVGIALDEDGNVCRFERWYKIPWPTTMSRIANLTGRTRALVDSTGLGDPVLEQLQTTPLSRFEGYLFSAPSKQKLMEGLAVAIQSESVGFPEGVIRIELENFEYTYTRTGVKYTAPEGFHDDCVCALALAQNHRSHARKPMIITDAILEASRQPMRKRA